MTNRARTISLVGFDGAINLDAIDGALADRGIDPTANYNSTDLPTLKEAAIEVLNSLIVSSVSEGGYSVSFSVELIKSRIAYLQGGTVGEKGTEKLNIW